MATTRERLHEMIDALPPDLLAEAEDAIAALTEPPLRSIGDVPEDDEPITDEDRTSLTRTHQAYLRGDLVSHDEAMRALGL